MKYIAIHISMIKVIYGIKNLSIKLFSLKILFIICDNFLNTLTSKILKTSFLLYELN